MPHFGETSQERLRSCHPDLQRVFNEVIKTIDCAILEGFRAQHKQNEAFREGRSKLKWDQSKHNKVPSKAVDAVPFPIDWDDKKRFHVFAGFVMGVASQMGIEIRWGGDWDGDWDFTDQRFHDLPHFELRHG